MNREEKIAQCDELFAEAKELYQTCKREFRDFTDAESARFDELVSELTTMRLALGLPDSSEEEMRKLEMRAESIVREKLRDHREIINRLRL